MIKIIKEKLPVGCVIVEKMEPDPMICPIENSGLKVALKFLESSHGTPDESYVIIDKKTIDPIFINVIKNIISGMKCRNMQRIRLDDIVSHFSDEEDGKLICLDLDEDYSIIGEDVAGKLTNLSFSEISNFANFPIRIDSNEVLNVRQVGGSYKPSGEKLFDDIKDKNKSIRDWNLRNKKFLEENGIPYAPEVKAGPIDALKKAHSATSSVAGILGDIGGTIDAIDKLQSWWEKYKTNKSYEREEAISRQKVFERNRLSSMFLRSSLKKVESDGFESLKTLTSIYNMGYSAILQAPNYFRPEYLKIIFMICSICVANALPPNRIIGTRLSLSALQSLYSRLESKYGPVEV